MFALPAGTQALQRTFYCRLHDEEGDTLISVPNVLGALVLKGAAFRQDSRDTRRHLDDAVILAACIREPVALCNLMKGSDRSRIIGLYERLKDHTHPSWMLLEDDDRDRAGMNLRILAENPQGVPGFRRIGRT
ncbi:hypothetical protein ACIPWF_21975 [Paenarthrobacter sp. NPDC089989]|uniref:hypothetical protein n=1 Tax=unclassified Paenarthrobacter TaxID=2634190 RepID=UPI003810B019